MPNLFPSVSVPSACTFSSASCRLRQLTVFLGFSGQRCLTNPPLLPVCCPSSPSRMDTDPQGSGYMNTTRVRGVFLGGRAPARPSAAAASLEAGPRNRSSCPLTGVRACPSFPTTPGGHCGLRVSLVPSWVGDSKITTTILHADRKSTRQGEVQPSQNRPSSSFQDDSQLQSP